METRRDLYIFLAIKLQASRDAKKGEAMNAKIVCLLAAIVMLNAASTIRAEEKETKKGAKGAPERLYPRGPEIEKLKTEGGLSDDEIKKMKDAIQAIEKKNSEVTSQDAVKAADEEVKKAKDALKAAEAKRDLAAEGFDLTDERKKAAYEAVPEAKREKIQDILHYKPKVEKKEKKDDKK
jgi:hypothetical protein